MKNVCLGILLAQLCLNAFAMAGEPSDCAPLGGKYRATVSSDPQIDPSTLFVELNGEELRLTYGILTDPRHREERYIVDGEWKDGDGVWTGSRFRAECREGQFVLTKEFFPLGLLLTSVFELKDGVLTETVATRSGYSRVQGTYGSMR